MFCLIANEANYLKSGEIYQIQTLNAGERLKKLSDNDVLNSRKVVNKVKNSLSQIEHYKSSEIHSRGEAATLNLLSYEWVFDIVPCFYTDTRLYLIPDGDGNWKATDPTIDQNLVTSTNQKYDGKALQLIRTLKYWNKHNSSYIIGSYLYEQLILNYINSRDNLTQWIDLNIKDFFYYLSRNIYHAVNDPKGIQGNLNILRYDQQKSISDKASWAYNKATEAINSETQDKDQEKAINKWREIFGNKFPSYA